MAPPTRSIAQSKHAEAQLVCDVCLWCCGQARAFLETKELASEVQKKAQENMMEHGISGVPFFVIQG
jgi:hypothetical protein